MRDRRFSANAEKREAVSWRYKPIRYLLHKPHRRKIHDLRCAARATFTRSQFVDTQSTSSCIRSSRLTPGRILVVYRLSHSRVGGVLPHHHADAHNRTQWAGPVLHLDVRPRFPSAPASVDLGFGAEATRYEQAGLAHIAQPDPNRWRADRGCPDLASRGQRIQPLWPQSEGYIVDK